MFIAIEKITNVQKHTNQELEKEVYRWRFIFKKVFALNYDVIADTEITMREIKSSGGTTDTSLLVAIIV